MSRLPSQVATNGLGPGANAQAHDENVSGALIAGKYRLQSPLGEGGMGSVWLAQNVDLDTPVALKRILPGMHCEQARQRLRIEARVGARLRHPGIIRVLDFGQTERGDAFIVMEVLEGISLGQFVARRGRLDPIEAVQLILPIVDALCHAHACGVVHRDLKPDNIFLDRVGSETHPKLLDFGIAKLTDEQSPHHTLSGQVLGSPAYMAPEQARGEGNVDHRADIWALCVVLYEAISGRLAFGGEGDVPLRSVIDDEVEPLEDRNAGEYALWQVLKRGLRKDRDRRFQSMRELGTALAGWLIERGENEDLRGSRLSRRWSVPALDDGALALECQAQAPSEASARQRRRLEALPRAAPRTAPRVEPSDAHRQRSKSEVALAFAAAVALVVVLLPSEGRPGHPAAIPEVFPALTTTASAANLTSAPREGPLRLVQAGTPFVWAPEARWASSSRSQAVFEEPSVAAKPPLQPITETELDLKVPY